MMHAFMEFLYSGEGSIQPRSSVKEALNVIVQAQWWLPMWSQYAHSMYRKFKCLKTDDVILF